VSRGEAAIRQGGFFYAALFTVFVLKSGHPGPMLLLVPIGRLWVNSEPEHRKRCRPTLALWPTSAPEGQAAAMFLANQARFRNGFQMAAA
jgi:hypothetical protein